MLHCMLLNTNKAVGCGIFRPEAAGDVISGMALDYVGTADVHASLSDQRLNSGRII